MTGWLIEQARTASNLTQRELAALAGTSRPTLSAYEHGRTSPSLDTAERILRCAGFELAAVPRVRFREHVTSRGRPFHVADGWWRLAPERAVADVALPLSLNWAMPDHTFRLSDRRERARCYEIVLREGAPPDITRFVDGLLMIDLWSELVLPREIKAAWHPLVASTGA